MNELTREDICHRMLLVIAESGVLRAMRRYNLPNIISDYFSVSWEWGWGIGADITVKFGVPKDGYYVSPEVEVSWGSTSYSPARARTVAILHSHVADLACRFEAMLSETKVKYEEEP